MSSGQAPALEAIDPEFAAESNLPRILGVVGVFHFLALFFVGVRLYTRVFVVRAPRSDDVVMVLAAVGALGGYIIYLCQIQYGLGRHSILSDPADRIEFAKLGYVQSIAVHILALGLLKISLALSLLRLSRTRWYTWALWSLIAFVVAYTIMACCTFFFHCTPFRGNWDSSITRKCYPITLFVTFALVNTGFNIFTDVVCATLPIPIIWTLKMKLRTRIYLVVILSLGYFAVAMGGVKAYFQIAQPRGTDAQFDQWIQFYACLQLNLGIIAACAPTLKPLVGHALKLSSRDKYYGEYYGNNNSRQSRAIPLRSAGVSRTDRGFDDLDFELNNQPYGNATNRVQTTVAGGTDSEGVYEKTHPERSGSEEMILQGGDLKRIVRTTEIEVRG
ncbi:hypothetical protein HJFPF1_01801 [Paramyrothecium foliicola]|nr:hypothetical protein HJFPF1_01801 [Paramyrothecium foliicola]